MKERGIVCELGVADVSTSIVFYEKLGFKRIEVLPADAPASWAELSFHGSRLMLQEINELADELSGIAAKLGRPSHAIVLRVGSIADAELLHDRLGSQEAQGLTDIHRTSYGTAEFSVIDPDGYVVLIAGS
jgi:uncharacterized glyoxalase superfamily protein PhnB